MKPRNRLATAKSPDGTELSLYEHDGAHEIVAGRAGLMSSRQHNSELDLGRLGCEELDEGSTVLIGGLGMGFTLRAALDHLPKDGKIIQVELMQEIVDWNRGPLADHAGNPLEDERVQLIVGDVGRAIEKRRGKIDSIVLDVDNGAQAMVTGSNRSLYSHSGLELLRRSLKPGGRLAIWSAADDPRLAAKMRNHNFEVSQHRAYARPNRKGSLHFIYVGHA